MFLKIMPILMLIGFCYFFFFTEDIKFLIFYGIFTIFWFNLMMYEDIEIIKHRL